MPAEIFDKVESDVKPFESGESVDDLNSKSVLYREDFSKEKSRLDGNIGKINTRLQKLKSIGGDESWGEMFENIKDAVSGDNQAEYDEAVTRVNGELTSLESRYQPQMDAIEAQFTKDQREVKRDGDMVNLLSSLNDELETLISGRVEAIVVAQEIVPGSDAPEAEEAVAYAEARTEETLQDRSQEMEDAIVEDNALGDGLIKKSVVAMKDKQKRLDDIMNQ